jgi:hypothetical protein
VKTAAQSVRQLDSTLHGSGQTPAPLPAIVADPARRPAATLARLESAIGRGDRSAVAAEVAHLDSLDALLHAALVARGVKP